MLTVEEAYNMTNCTWPTDTKDAISHIDSLIYIQAYRKGQYSLRIYQDELPEGFILTDEVVSNLEIRGFKVEIDRDDDSIDRVEVYWDMEDV